MSAVYRMDEIESLVQRCQQQDNPDVASMVNQLVTLADAGAIYPASGYGTQSFDESYGQRERLVVNGQAAM